MNVTVGAILHLILTEALKDFVFEVEEDLLRKASSRFSYQKGPGLGPVFKVNMRLAIGRGVLVLTHTRTIQAAPGPKCGRLQFFDKGGDSSVGGRLDGCHVGFLSGGKLVYPYPSKGLAKRGCSQGT